MIEIQNLNFGFKAKEKILNNVCLNIKNEGQVIGLLGSNGAGKTTMLNVLAGYYQKNKGTIKTNNSFFFLPDQAYLPTDLTIGRCLHYFGQLYTTFNVERAKMMLQYLKLDFNKKIGDYSKGMKEQLHIVLALAQDVDTYLLDEPLAAVDPLTRSRLVKFIMDDRRTNSNVIISTHLIGDVSDIFDEVIFIDEGTIIVHDKVDKLVEEHNQSLEDIYKEVMSDAYSFRTNY